MAASMPNGNLVRATYKDVEIWLHEAWPRRKIYPGDCTCQALATAINTVVDRANASAERERSIEAVKKRRASLVEAQKHARGLQRALIPVLDYHQSTLDNSGSLPASSVFGPEPNEFTVINDLHRAVEAFIALGRPQHVRDHQDQILWMACATRQA